MTSAVLVTTWGAPMGSAYFKRLRQISHLALSVMYETNEKLEKEIERIYRERFGDKAPRFEPASSLAGEGAVEIVEVASANSQEGLKILRVLEPDFLILGGSGIVKEEVLRVPKRGAVNCHPGLLPRYRGCTCVEWAIFEDQPVGATCHFVTEEIDAGDIILKKIMPVMAGDTYLEIRLRMFDFQADLLAEAVDRLVNQSERTKGQIQKFDWSQAQYYKPIPPDQMSAVLRKLQKREYSSLPR